MSSKPSPIISCNHVINLVKPYYSALKARENEGRPYIMRSVYAILVKNLINVERISWNAGFPYDPATGEGFLLLERCLFIDVVCADEFDPVTKRHYFIHDPFIPYHIDYSSVKWLVINFGGDLSTKYIINGKRTRTLATGVRIRHLTSNMLNGFYILGW